MVTAELAVQVGLRWVHFVAGITWIGLLYYFNMVQSPGFLKGLDGGTRAMIVTKLLRRQLNFFRWTALITVIAGVLLTVAIWGFEFAYVPAFFGTSRGISITTGGLLALIMIINVWGIIWPNQKRVIRLTAEAAEKGQPAPPEAAKYGRRARLASRANFGLSFPMLFFMAAASHFPLF